MPEFAALIGDVVGSKRYGRRAALQAAIRKALDRTNARIEATQPLAPTIGDEFQGLYPDVAGAIRASMLIRLHLSAKADARFGIGWGPLKVFKPEKVPFEQDGPAWWAARDAISQVAKSSNQKERPRGWRTAFLISDAATIHRRSPKALTREFRLLGDRGGEGPDLATAITLYVDSLLVCRDELVGGLTDRDVRILLALLDGQRQSVIARRESISQSAVSQKGGRSGIYALLQMDRALEKDLSWNLSASG